MDEKFTARSTNIGPLEVRGKIQFIFFLRGRIFRALSGRPESINQSGLKVSGKQVQKMKFKMDMIV